MQKEEKLCRTKQVNLKSIELGRVPKLISKDRRSKGCKNRVVDQRDVINSDFPVKIALSQHTNDLGQIILIHIAKAYGDVWHPMRRMIVILDTRTCTENFLPKCFMELR